MNEHNLPEELTDIAFGEDILRGFWNSKEHDLCWLSSQEDLDG